MPTAPTGPGPSIATNPSLWSGKFVYGSGTSFGISSDGLAFTALAHSADAALFPTNGSDAAYAQGDNIYGSPYPVMNESAIQHAEDGLGQRYLTMTSAYYSATFLVQMNAAVPWTDAGDGTMTPYPFGTDGQLLSVGKKLFAFAHGAKIAVGDSTKHFKITSSAPVSATGTTTKKPICIGCFGTATSPTYVAIYMDTFDFDFAASATKNVVLTSPDGETWTSNALLTSNIAYLGTAPNIFGNNYPYQFAGMSNGRAIFCLYTLGGGSNPLVMSTADGVTWTRGNFPVDGNFYETNVSAAVSPTGLVLAANTSAYRSGDGGKTFTAINSTGLSFTGTVRYVGGKFLLAGSGKVNVSFDDGVTFHDSLAPNGAVVATAYSNSKRWFFPDAGNGVIHYTDDFITWSSYAPTSGQSIPVGLVDYVAPPPYSASIGHPNMDVVQVAIESLAYEINTSKALAYQVAQEILTPSIVSGDFPPLHGGFA